MASRTFYSTAVSSRNSMAVRQLRREFNGIVAYGQWMAMREMAFEHGGMLDLSGAESRAATARELEMKPQALMVFAERLSELGEIDGPLWRELHHVVFPQVAEEVRWIRERAG